MWSIFLRFLLLSFFSHDIRPPPLLSFPPFNILFTYYIHKVVVHVLSTDGGAYGSGGGAERRGGFGGFNDVATLSTVVSSTSR